MEYDFIIEYFDEELKLRIRFCYWSKNSRFYMKCIREDGVSSKAKIISEECFISALEEYHNA